MPKTPLRQSSLPPPAREPDEGVRIGRHLRHIYDDVLHEPVPDHFAELLRKLG